MGKFIHYGYEIINGKAVINEEEAERVRNLYSTYIECHVINHSIEKVMPFMNRHTGRSLLVRKVYLGDDFYPQIIDEDTFYRVQQIMKDRAYDIKVTSITKKEKKLDINRYEFSLTKKIKKYKDPYKQAEYLYSQIKEKFNER